MTIQPSRIEPHPALTLRDGQPYSELYGDVFKSRQGAAREADQVFVEGSEARARWRGRRHFTILEIGFGLGVNLWRTVEALRGDPLGCAHLHYLTIERHPLARGDLVAGLESIGVPNGWIQGLAGQWPDPLPGLHRLEFLGGQVLVTLCLGDAPAMLRRLRAAVDVFYLDGFAPTRNPDAWSPAVASGLARLARPGARLTTYSAAGSVQDALRGAGFDVGLTAGFDLKRERIVADYRPSWRTWPPPAPPTDYPVRDAIVVGAGLAGSACCAALSRRGWRVTLVERHGDFAAGGSSQPWCVDHPHVSIDDNPLARVSRAGLLFGERLGWARRAANPGGKLLVARDPAQLESFARITSTLRFPSTFLRMVDRDQGGMIAGVRLPAGALHFPRAGFGSPLLLCRRWAASLSDEGRLFDRHAATLSRSGDCWRVLDGEGRSIAQAPVVVLANAGDLSRLARLRRVEMRAMAGQTTTVDDPRLAGLRCALGGHAYACPTGDGYALVGATFDEHLDAIADDTGDRSNLARLDRLLGSNPSPGLTRVLGRHAGIRYATRDRMPLVGALADESAAREAAAELARNDRLPLPRQQGLFAACALGSRGMVMAPLIAETIAAIIEGEPLPLETDLLAALDVARDLRRALRTRRFG